MILFLHNRYRTEGGEEATVHALAQLVRTHLGEPACVLERDSSQLGRARAAAGLLAGGLQPGEVASAVRERGARVVHAHNLHPTLGWRALAAARAAGARVVVHLHNYRLVCAIGVCFTRGEQCTRCHGADTLPGVRLRCRGSAAEAAVYGAALAGWQRRLIAQADAFVVPSEFARERLRALGAPLPWERVHVLAPPVPLQEGARTAGAREHALVVSRLAAEKGVAVAIDACRRARLALVIAGEGPLAHELRERAGADEGSLIRFVGRVDEAALTQLRASAAVALVPSLTGETFGLAAAQAMAAGVPVVASRVGALPELVDEDGLVAAGDADALAHAAQRLWADAAAGERARKRVEQIASPDVVAQALARVYSG